MPHSSDQHPLSIAPDEVLRVFAGIADNVGRMTAVGVDTSLKVDRIIDTQNSMNLKFAEFQFHLKAIQDDNKEIKTAIQNHEQALSVLQKEHVKIWSDMYGDNDRKDSMGIFHHVNSYRNKEMEREGVRKFGAGAWLAILGCITVLSFGMSFVGTFIAGKYVDKREVEHYAPAP